MIYLDNNATTRVAPEVIDAMQPYLGEIYANPSSNYTMGRAAKAAIETARAQTAALLGASDTREIVFTSGGSESDNWAIRAALVAQPDRRHIVTTAVEHEAVRNLCLLLEKDGYEVTWLPVDGEGALDLDQLRAALRPDTAVVSAMLAQNETGVLFPMAEIGRIVREHSNALFHVDGVQATGKIPIDLKTAEVDLFAVSGHKLYAPKGIGALYVRTGVNLTPQTIGGAQEGGRRAGTEAVPSIVALGKACDLAAEHLNELDASALRNHLEDTILATIPNAVLNGTTNRTKRLPNTANISFAYLEGSSIMAHLDDAEIYVSTGSACHSATKTASPVLRAMNVPYTTAMGSIRFSTGRFNTREEIDETILVLTEVVDRLIEISPYEKELGTIPKTTPVRP